VCCKIKYLIVKSVNRTALRHIEGGKQMTREELVKEGLNESITHVDFMVGSKDMNG
jgi:leucyl aminopeptidase (aminopeptidase T)